MMNLQTEERINHIISTIVNCPQSEVLSDKHFYLDLLADSLMMIDLMLMLEQEFAININDDALNELNIVSDLYQVIDEHQTLM